MKNASFWTLGVCLLLASPSSWANEEVIEQMKKLGSDFVAEKYESKTFKVGAEST